MSTFAVIMPAAGASSRFGGREKKPYANIDGRAVWIRTAEMFVNRDDVKQLILVISPEDREMFKSKFAANAMFMNVRVVDGGKERTDSIANALSALDDGVEFVAIHDAVRPCTPTSVIDAVFKAAIAHGAAIPAIPVADTLKRVDRETVEATVSRAGLWQAQTPQVFAKDVLKAAYAGRGSAGAEITDDSQLVEKAGKRVRIVTGSPFNIKITRPEDLKLAGQLIKLREAEAPKRVARAFDDERFM